MTPVRRETRALILLFVASALVVTKNLVDVAALPFLDIAQWASPAGALVGAILVNRIGARRTVLVAASAIVAGAVLAALFFRAGTLASRVGSGAFGVGALVFAASLTADFPARRIATLCAFLLGREAVDLLLSSAWWMLYSAHFTRLCWLSILLAIGIFLTIGAAARRRKELEAQLMPAQAPYRAASKIEDSAAPPERSSPTAALRSFILPAIFLSVGTTTIFGWAVGPTSSFLAVFPTAGAALYFLGRARRGEPPRAVILFAFALVVTATGWLIVAGGMQTGFGVAQIGSVVAYATSAASVVPIAYAAVTYPERYAGAVVAAWSLGEYVMERIALHLTGPPRAWLLLGVALATMIVARRLRRRALPIEIAFGAAPPFR
jgi:hypothetical protein